MTVLSQSQLVGLAQSVGLSSSASQIAAAIAMAESGGNTTAVNPGSATDHEYSVGLWQINLLAHPQYTVTQMYDPQQNAKAMSVISNGGLSWGAWGTYTSGAYLKYMKTVTATPYIPTSYANLSTSGLAATSVAGLSSTVKTSSAVTSNIGSAWTYILAYIVAIAIFVFISRFQAGYNALYYMAVLLLILLILTSANAIAKALSPITSASQSGQQTTLV